jgi:hypothetical protein
LGYDAEGIWSESPVAVMVCAAAQRPKRILVLEDTGEERVGKIFCVSVEGGLDFLEARI